MPKRKISYLKMSVFWPCGECRQNCTENSVQCDSCNSWYHYDCQQLSLSDIDVLVNTSSNNKTLNARLLARVITGCHYT